MTNTGAGYYNQNTKLARKKVCGMKMAFHEGNRKTLYETLPEGSLVLVFSGHAPRKTQDENYPFYANRNFEIGRAHV